MTVVKKCQYYGYYYNTGKGQCQKEEISMRVISDNPTCGDQTLKYKTERYKP